MKKIILITLMFLLLTGSVFAVTFTDDFIMGVTDEQINEFISPKIDTRFIWEDNQLKIKVTYKTIRNIDESYELFEQQDKEFYPSANLQDFYTCRIVARQSITTCINTLIFSSEKINYEGIIYKPMYYQVIERTNQERKIINKYKEKIAYKNLINEINTELEQKNILNDLTNIK
jgi:hypothetical protein